MSDQSFCPSAAGRLIHEDDWNVIKRRVEYPNALAALIWTYQDGYRRALRDSHDAHLALGMPQPPKETLPSAETLQPNLHCFGCGERTAMTTDGLCSACVEANR